MNLFLKKFLIFITIPFLVYTISILILKQKLINSINKSKVIILGDSQTEFISNPQIYNFSIHGSPYFVHYEFIINNIDQIKEKTVFIACNYHNLSKLYQNRLINDSLLPGWKSNNFKIMNRYNIINKRFNNISSKGFNYPLIDIKKVPNLFKEMYLPKKAVNTISSVINDTLSIDKDIYKHWKNKNYILEDTIQNFYLEKMITKLKANKCKVYLLKMPLTNYYKNRVPSNIKVSIFKLSEEYSINIIDLDKELNISCKYHYFKDYGHLNKSGDSLVNHYFRKNIK